MSQPRADKPSLGEVLRTLTFYAAFYVGSIGYVLLALAALVCGRTQLAKVVRAWSRFHRGCMAVFLGIRVMVRGRVPEGQWLIAIKHESFAEAIDLPMLFASPVIFAKAELLRIPLWGKAAEFYGLVAVERSAGARAMRAMITAARAASAQGRDLVIFPEGTRVPHGERHDLQAGFAGLYKLLALPVLPVAVDSGRLYHRRWKRAGTIHVDMGEPIAAGLPREEIEARVLAAINTLNP